MDPVTVRFSATRNGEIISGYFVVDRKSLAEELALRNSYCRHSHTRPGEKLDLTGTQSDPISHDVAGTGLLILRTYKSGA